MAVSTATYDNARVWGPVIVVLALVVANLLAWALNERSWAYRRCLSRAHVPKMLFISNRAEGVSKHTRPSSYWGFDLLNPRHLVTSPVLSTNGLLVLHACTFLYWVAFIFVDVLIDWYGYGCHYSGCTRRSGGYAAWMTYLTNWSITILGFSGLVALADTARYARWQRQARRQQQQQQGRRVELAPAAPAGEEPVTTAGMNTASPQLGTGQLVPMQLQPQPQQDGFRGPGQPQTNVPPSGTYVQPPHVLPQQQQHPQQQQRVDGSSTSPGSSSSYDTVVVVQRDGQASPEAKAAHERWDWLSVTHCLLSEVATSAAFFVSFWFWVGLVGIAGQGFTANGGTIMAHAGNLLIALLQLLLTRLPMVSTHFQVLLWYASLYEVFLWAYGGGSGEWRYGLDWQKRYSAGALVLVPLVVFIFFCLWYLVALAREAAVRRTQQRKHARRTRLVQKQQQQQRRRQGVPGAAV